MPNFSGGNAAAGWYPDPYQRHQTRYWNGVAWTEHVADNGMQSVDAMMAAHVAPVASYPTYTAPYGAAPVTQRSAGSVPAAIILIAAGAAGALASWIGYLTLKFDSSYGIGDDSATGWEVQKALGQSDRFSYSMIATVLACALAGVLGIVLLVNASSPSARKSAGVPATAAIAGVVAAIFTVLSYTLTSSVVDDMAGGGLGGYSVDVTLGIGAGFVLQLASAVVIVIVGIVGIAGANKGATV